MIRKSEQSGPSEVEVAGGYLLDHIRAHREMREASERLADARAAVAEASERESEASARAVGAETRLHAFVKAHIEA